MFDEVKSDAPDDGHFIGGHGTKKLLDCHFFVRDFGGRVEDVIVGDLDNFGLKSRLFGGAADIEVRRRQDWLTPQLTTVCCDETNESIPVWCHDASCAEVC